MKIRTTAGDGWNWNRKEIAHWIVEQIFEKSPIIIGIDHGFSFPISYMARYKIDNWDQFLEDFKEHWPTDQDHTYVDFVRDGNPRTGSSKELRLSEKWTPSAKSVFQLDGQGSVGKSTHSGIPWLLFIRTHPEAKNRVHFWPFDGFDIPANKSVIAEAYPSLFRRRYPKNKRTTDEQDAWSLVMWLKTMDQNGYLSNYFKPPLTGPEQKIAQLEGWILGVY